MGQLSCSGVLKEGVSTVVASNVVHWLDPCCLLLFCWKLTIERAFCVATFWAMQRWGKGYLTFRSAQETATDTLGFTGMTVGVIAHGRQHVQYYTRCIYSHSVWLKRDASNLAASARP